MAPIYTGSLAPKKKSDLQEIAIALRIGDQGTKDELVQRITKHLDANQDALEDNPQFSGLFGRRRRSAQPQPIPASRLAAATSEEKPRSSRKPFLQSIRETTPVNDLRDISTFLKHPPDESPDNPRQVTPSSLPPLPPSPIKSVLQRLPNAAEVKAAVTQFKEQQVLQNGNELLVSLRHFLSNSRNIWSITAVVELFQIISVTIPWKTFQVPISPKGAAGPQFALHYPPLAVFQTATFWIVLLHWALPSLIIPTLSGCLISFNPNLAPRRPDGDAPIAPLDPLTAAITRLFVQYVYPYAVVAAKQDITNLDVLGSQWRITSAALTLAFAFSEAISSAPQALANTIVHQERRLLRFDLEETEPQSATPIRPAIMARGESDDEVD